MKYIDSNKLITEIEKLYEIARNASYNGEVEGEMTAYDKILSFIPSLQQEQPEVDLEKEIDIQKMDFMELYNRVKKLLDDFGNLDADIAKDITELREYIKSLDM